MSRYIDSCRWMTGRVYWISALCLFLLLLICSRSSDAVLSTEIYKPEYHGIGKYITLPYNAASQDNQRLTTFEIKFSHDSHGSQTWKVISNNCVHEVRINKLVLDLLRLEIHPCDFEDGMDLDLRSYLRHGANTLEITVENSEGRYELDVQPTTQSLYISMLLFNILKIVVPILFMVCFCHFLQRHNIDYATIGLFILSAALSLHYLHVSSDSTPTNDIGWHIRYIGFIEHYRFPVLGYSKQQISHPPLYYCIAAALSSLNSSLIGLPTITLLRFLSWVFFMVFHVFNLLTLRRLGFSGINHYCCAALLLLWPGNAHLASKINSEAMYYAFASISFYYIVSWYQQGAERHLIKASLFTGIAFITRTNAFVICLLIMSLVLVAITRKRLAIKVFFTKKWLLVGVALSVCLAIHLSYFFLYRSDSIYTGMLLQHDPIPLTPYVSLLYHFERPFGGDTTTTTFYEFLLKTSMFGEYRWPAPELAEMMNYGVFMLFWFCVLPVIYVHRAYWRGMLPFVLYILFSVLFVVYFSYNVKDMASRDARYIYPALIAFVAIFGKNQAYYAQNGFWVLRWFGVAISSGFVLLSTYYFWNYHR